MKTNVVFFAIAAFLAFVWGISLFFQCGQLIHILLFLALVAGLLGVIHGGDES